MRYLVAALIMSLALLTAAPAQGNHIEPDLLFTPSGPVLAYPVEACGTLYAVPDADAAHLLDDYARKRISAQEFLERVKATLPSTYYDGAEAIVLDCGDRIA